MRRPLAIAVAAVVFAGGAFGIWTWRKQAGGKGGPKYETVAIERGDIIAKVTATGTLSALVTVQVGTQVSGRIKDILVDFNAPVKKGQVIARLEPALFQAAVESARANNLAVTGTVAKLEAQAENARLQHERAQALFERKAIAQADLDTARATQKASEGELAAARGNLAQTRASLHQAEVNLSYATIISPTTGVVISRSVDVGQTVAASLASPTLFLIAEDLTKMQVDTSVAEADIGKLKPGMEATFSVDAFPSKVFKGAVRQIRNAPQTQQNVVTYDAVIDVSNPALELRPGMTANVTFVYDHREGVLRVANAALRFQPPADLTKGSGGGGNGSAQAATKAKRGGGKGGAEARDRRTVWLQRGAAQTLTSVRVKIGVTDGTNTEIETTELGEGDRVITDAETGNEPKGAATSGNTFRRVF